MRPSIWDCNKTKAHCMNGHEWSLHSLYHILKLHYIILYLSSCFPSSCTGATSAFLTDLPTYTPYRVLFKTPIQFAIPIPADRPTDPPANEPTNRPGHSLWIYRLHPKPINISPISFPRDHHNNNNNNNNRIRVVFLFKSPVTTDTRSLSRPPIPHSQSRRRGRGLQSILAFVEEGTSQPASQPSERRARGRRADLWSAEVVDCLSHLLQAMGKALSAQQQQFLSSCRGVFIIFGEKFGYVQQL